MKKTCNLKKLNINKTTVRVLTLYNLKDIVGGTAVPVETSVEITAGCSVDCDRSRLCTDFACQEPDPHNY